MMTLPRCLEGSGREDWLSGHTNLDLGRVPINPAA